MAHSLMFMLDMVLMVKVHLVVCVVDVSDVS